MIRREFLKALGALGVTTIAPDIFSDSSFIGSAHASPAISAATVSVPTVTPQVINIFLYGGASELAGNLTNISDLNRESQSKYTELNPRFLDAYDPTTATPGELAQGRVGQLTPNAFWAHAGGIIMEDMLLDGDMSIYRTCYRKKNNTRAHRPSIFSTQKGTLDIDSAPGIGSTLAAVISENRSAYEAVFGKNLEDLIMPMVSFQGESTIFAPDPNAATPIPLSLKSVGLSANFDNPYQRTPSTDPAPTKDILNALVDSRMKAEPDIADSDLLTPAYGQRYKKVSESFLNHRKLAVLVDSYRTILNKPNALPLLPEGDPDGANPDFNSVLYNAYQQALLGVGRNFEHSSTYPEDPLYVAPAPLTPQGTGLDNVWVDITTTVNNVTTTVKESRFLAFDLTPILDPDTDPRINGIPGQANRLVYPANNNFGSLLKAAVTLAIYNKDTKFIMVGSPGLGGWDDHNSAMMSYEARMQTLMSAVRAAIKHVKYSHDDATVLSADYRNGQSTDNIIFNITTDFGRNANLNNSKGWDHGNNQNFYTFGGRPYVRDSNYTLEDGSSPVAAETPVTTVDKFYPQGDAATLVPAVRVPGALGKIVGTTNIFGTPGQNRWFTKPSHPTDDAVYNQDAPQIPSYEFEPQAVASTIYSWFGVTNPEVLTQNNDDDFANGSIQRYGTNSNGTLDASESSISTAAGEPAIDESLPSVHVNIRLPVKNIVT
ncbi:MAG: hypothetical protein OEY36_02090 [Gammaproteobacteria bacterium]|nr:hypothetical protein [Gammaproteobacteria bacterium]